ncbi:MAG: 30S ribosomal protein S3 [Candidatus Woesebacteria bacterium GW2011_GWA1_37_7]|uniref:Small ribosomal subunit protein uS3 n=1 Tax=Candidatus Woesebacteria bacterium GW2011_GWA1_37_7 TaxID=1618545 RepID=A0A0G0H5G1_9BACT|nr:MAG: 30S ribosomal protein S3 [Candidatus Woesebacteria bacterium GW2011_GWA1_37_7]
MGQKINPIGFRLGSYLPWKSRWFSEDSSYKDFLLEDIKIRKALFERLKLAGITNVEIERLPKSMVIILTVSRPGIVIGRGGTGLEDLKKYIIGILQNIRGRVVKDTKIDLRVNEVKDPELSAQLVASRIVSDLERRMPGIKVVLSGRIGGIEIARVEKFHRGSVPTQVLRERIDYAQMPALLKKGYVGIKVYIHKKRED